MPLYLVLRCSLRRGGGDLRDSRCSGHLHTPPPPVLRLGVGGPGGGEFATGALQQRVPRAALAQRLKGGKRC